MSDISNDADYIDIREVIERVEELHTIATDEAATQDDRTHANNELGVLQALLDECRGNGGDHQWNGDWYPVTLIRDSEFRNYAEELADDIGAVKSDAGWPTQYIDWDRAAEALQQDYTSVEYDGVTYWAR